MHRRAGIFEGKIEPDSSREVRVNGRTWIGGDIPALISFYGSQPSACFKFMATWRKRFTCTAAGQSNPSSDIQLEPAVPQSAISVICNLKFPSHSIATTSRFYFLCMFRDKNVWTIPKLYTQSAENDMDHHAYITFESHHPSLFWLEKNICRRAALQWLILDLEYYKQSSWFEKKT